MSKVFKSTYVHIGSPKPIENVFVRPEKAKINAEAIEEAAAAVDDSAEAVNPEEDANNIIEEAKQMYLKIIEEANFEARQIIDKAHGEAVIIKENERQAGYTEGFQEGKNQAQQIIDEAAEIRAFLDARKEQLLEEVEEPVIALLLDISKKIIGDELKQNREAIFSLIGEGLSRCAFKSKLTIRVSEADYEQVMAGKDRISSLIEGISELEIYSDLSMEAGGCVIETPSGEINSSIDVQLRELEKAFMYVLRNE